MDMSRKTLTDSEGDTLEFRAYSGGDIFVEVCESNCSGVAGPFTLEQLRAALTEPPARPEGAEDIEALLDDYHEDGLTLTGRLNVAPLADYLAGRGVRVVAEEMNR